MTTESINSVSPLARKGICRKKVHEHKCDSEYPLITVTLKYKRFLSLYSDINELMNQLNYSYIMLSLSRGDEMSLIDHVKPDYKNIVGFTVGATRRRRDIEVKIQPTGLHLDLLKSKKTSIKAMISDYKCQGKNLRYLILERNRIK